MSGRQRPWADLFDGDYAPDIFGDSDCVHLYGMGRAEVEGCRGVVSFTDSLLVLSMRRSNLAFRGSGLGIRRLDRLSLVVTARITALEWLEKGRSVSGSAGGK